VSAIHAMNSYVGVEVGRDLLLSLCADLRLLWVEAGGPSLRALERQVSLSKSQVGAILNGRVRRPPDWRVVSTLVECIHRHAVEQGRVDRLSLRTGVEEYWRPRFALLEHAFEETDPQARGTEVGAGRPVVPALLPPAVAGFAGRRDVLAVLDGLLATRAELSPAVLITAIGGTAGVGKTALAVHWAHRNAEAFPDGQLYVNLRGFDPDGSALGPAEAVRGFLDALGVPAEGIPAGVTAQVGLYRSLLADRRMLIVLDNARDVDQVRPLLPGGVGNMALVTSRNQLTPLVVTEGARSLTTDLLSDAESRELLARRLGRPLAGAEDGAVAEIIVRCARLPLALAVVAARAAVNPSLSLPRLAAQLRDQAGVLDTLRGGDPTTDVRTVFSWSCRGLPPGAARLFWLLGLHPTAEVGAAAAMSMAGGPPPSARAALGELARVHLVTERGPDRYELHDLLRVYAAEQAAAVVSDDHRRAALHRLLDHYVHTAHRASVLLDPHRYLGDAPEEIEPGVTPEDIVDTGHALRWFTTEHRTLLAAVEHAAEAGFPRHAWQLARAMNVYLYRQGHYHDLTASHRTALAAAKRAGDLTGQAHALRGIAAADGAVGRFRETRVSLEAALELFSQTGDHDGTGVIHENLGMLAAYTGDPGEALPHMRRSFELHQSTGRLAGQARALSSLGRCQAQLGDSVQAIHACEQALVMQRRLGDSYGIAYTWDSLGLAYAAAGDHHESARCHHRALELFRITGHRACQANEWDRIGDAQHAAGNIDAAEVAWCEAVTINDSIALSDAAGIRAKLLRHGVVLEADDLSD
jgi:tetratricopeptide (TPR) repeat protein